MDNYRRAWRPGGTCFFIVDFLQGSDNDFLLRHIDFFRETARSVRLTRPFTIHAWVVLVEHGALRDQPAGWRCWLCDSIALDKNSFSQIAAG
jgi:hypothetical protein